MLQFFLRSVRRTARRLTLVAFAVGLTAPVLAQPGYLAIDALIAPETYQDLGTTGTVIPVANPDDANSAPQPIGFTFPYAGQTFTQFIFNTNGFIKLGSVAPSSAALYLTNPQSYTGPAVFASTDPLDEFIISPFNYNLESGTAGAADFRVSTTGAAPNRVCTIQWKNVRDKEMSSSTGTVYPTQYDNFEFQLKLYETNRRVEFVYGTATPSPNTIGFRGAHAGLKGVAGSVPLTVQKSSATPWDQAVFRDANYTGLRFNFKKDVVPNRGLTYRFLPDLCPRPANLNVTVSGTTATVTFSGATGAQSYNVVYGPVGFVPPTGGTTVTTTTNSATITGLVTGQPYVAYVQSSCGAGLLGGFAGPVYFCQAGVITTLPYVENFDGVPGGNRLPCGISVENVNGDTARWRNLRVNTLAASPPNAMRIETRSGTTGTAKDDWFYLPGFQMTAGQNYDISFLYRVGSTTQPERLEVKAGTAANAAAMTTLLFQDTLITRGTFLNAPRASATFTAPTTGVFYFGFHAFSRPGRYRLYVDDVRVEPGPACATVTAVSVRNLTPTSAQVNFSSAFGNNFIVRYGPRGFNPATSGTSVPTTTTQVTLTGLAQLTAYDVYVIRDCGSVGFSASVGPVGFFTPCAAPTVTVLPYDENFDTTPAGRLPCGWTTENINGDTIEWRNRRANASADSPPNALAIRWNPNVAMNDWAFTPGLQLTAGQNYQFSFDYRVGTATSPEALEVKAGSAANSAQMTIPLFRNGRLINTIYQTAIITFVVPTTGVYYIGFHGQSDANRLRIFVDDVHLELGPACPGPTDLLAQSVTATTATLTYTAALGAAGYTIIYGAQGFDPLAGGTTVTATGVATLITGLSPLTTYDFYVRTNCGAGVTSGLAGPRSFTTLCPPPTLSPPLVENFDSITVNTLPCGWTVINANADTAQWRVLNLANLTASPPNGMRIDSETPKDDWFVSPALQLFAGVTYDLNFEARSGGAPEALEVRVGTAATVAALAAGEQVFNDTVLTVSTFPNPLAGQFIPTASGTYYFGWHAYTGRDANRLYVDNIAITPSAVCSPATTPAVTMVTSTTATASFTPGTGATYAVVYGPFGFNPLTGGTTVAAAGSSVVLTGLAPSTTYQAYVVGSCTGGAPALVGPVTFSTLVGLAPEALASAVRVFPNPTTGAVQVQLAQTGATSADLTVLDALGRIVHAATLVDNATRTLDLRALAPGLYTMRVRLDDQLVTRTLSVQR